MRAKTQTDLKIKKQPKQKHDLNSNLQVGITQLSHICYNIQVQSQKHTHIQENK